MKIAIIGATGKAGKLIMEEALKRGLDVTAIVRNKSKLSNSSVKLIEKDLFDLLENLLSNELNYFSAMLSKQELGNIIKIASKEKSNEDIASKFLELIKE